MFRLRRGLRQVLEHGDVPAVQLLPLMCPEDDVIYCPFSHQAMVDVDETYREPLLGQAFYHQKALTISRVCAGCKCVSNS